MAHYGQSRALRFRCFSLFSFLYFYIRIEKRRPAVAHYGQSRALYCIHRWKRAFFVCGNSRLVTSSCPAKHVLYRRENTHPPLERRGTERTDSRGEEEVQPTSVRGVMHGRDARKQPCVTYFTTYIIAVPSVHSVHPRSGACCFLTLNKRGSATHAR